MEKLLVIDGSSLLFQSFYGMPNQIKNDKGERVEAVICFIGIMLKTVKAISPNKLLVVFDGETKLERKEIDDNYKANRIDYTKLNSEDTPFPQLEIIKQVLSSLGVEWVETTTCEADDMIASIVNDYKTYYDITISSSDKDFYQLVCDNVSVYTYRGKISVNWTKEQILLKYNIPACHFLTFKVLTGDSADNIKGIKGVGKVTATKLINQYGNIFSIYQSLDSINPKTAELLKQNKVVALKNYELINLMDKTNLYTLQNGNFNLPKLTSVGILKSLGMF